MFTTKHFAPTFALFFMVAGMAATTQAAIINFTLTGDLEAVESGNPFGLAQCLEPGTTCTDSITATGSFDDSSFITGISGDIYTLVDLDIVVGTETFTNSMDFFGGGEIVLNTGSLISLDYTTVDGFFGAAYDFNSANLFFDTPFQFNGEWVPSSFMTVVPVPAALWLFGSGLLALAGIARKKMV